MSNSCCIDPLMCSVNNDRYYIKARFCIGIVNTSTMSTPAILDCRKHYRHGQQEKRQQVERLIQISINAQVIGHLHPMFEDESNDI